MWEGTDHCLLLEELPYQDNWYCLTSVKTHCPNSKINLKVLRSYSPIRYIFVWPKPVKDAATIRAKA
jgi:hypothetical protein